ncbi:Hypothetical protein NocV09_02800380 [Nannochloropsis oceanica]
MGRQAGATKDNAHATQKQQELVHAALDLSCVDWLNFPHWTKALELNDYPTFLLWLTDQDPVLASMVATRQEEFEAVLEKIKDEMK